MGVVPSHTENYYVLCRKSKTPSWAEIEKEEFFPALYAGLWFQACLLEGFQMRSIAGEYRHE